MRVERAWINHDESSFVPESSPLLTVEATFGTAIRENTNDVLSFTENHSVFSAVVGEAVQLQLKRSTSADARNLHRSHIRTRVNATRRRRCRWSSHSPAESKTSRQDEYTIRFGNSGDSAKYRVLRYFGNIFREINEKCGELFQITVQLIFVFILLDITED